MEISDEPLLFLDAQTTGLRPPRGELIEVGWTLAPASCDDFQVYGQRFSLQGSLPRKVSEITGWSEEDLKDQPHSLSWCDEVFKPWLLANAPKAAAIHYAQFEMPFFQDLFGPDLKVFCTHQITRKLFPELPSRNIRAVAGFFGHPLLGPNRAMEFAKATHVIWKALVAELSKRGIKTFADLTDWMSAPAEKKKRSYMYRITAQKRLELPKQPGIYRMLARNGAVLYVGKATSLRQRVNSYFRGQKGRDRRKLEMLAQVWDIQVETCGSPLEAALREADEIKRYDPPYNVVLRKGSRELCFYSRDFLESSKTQSARHPLGPFRPGDWIEMVRQLHICLVTGEFTNIFYQPIEPELMKEGYELFARDHGLTGVYKIRSLLAYGMKLYRHYEEPEEPQGTNDEVAEEEDVELTAEDLAGKFERLLRRAGAALWRARKMTRILNSDVEFLAGQEWRRIRFRLPEGDFPWTKLGIEGYDRANILLNELSRLEHRIHHPTP